MNSYGIMTIVIDDRGDEVSRTLSTAIYRNLSDVRDQIDWLVQRTRNDNNPLSVGWQEIYKVVRLTTVLGESRQADYGN